MFKKWLRKLLGIDKIEEELKIQNAMMENIYDEMHPEYMGEYMGQ